MKLIKVTPYFISVGDRCGAKSCPVALALLAKTDSRVCVGTAHGFINNFRLRFSRRVQNFIRAFDGNKPVKPATFILFERLKWLI